MCFSTFELQILSRASRDSPAPAVGYMGSPYMVTWSAICICVSAICVCLFVYTLHVSFACVLCILCVCHVYLPVVSVVCMCCLCLSICLYFLCVLCICSLCLSCVYAICVCHVYLSFVSVFCICHVYLSFVSVVSMSCLCLSICREEEGDGLYLKSNNPNLTGGEQSKNIRFVQQQSPTFSTFEIQISLLTRSLKRALNKHPERQLQ